ncbi:MAG: hypothetical protein IJ062_01720 [Firmicutes bacterium]|nr:hypothetical protein [Bacillota bacterium]
MQAGLYVYDTYDGSSSGIITDDMRAVKLNVYNNTIYNFIRFTDNDGNNGGFLIIAAIDRDKNRMIDPADTRYTTYFDENGVRIADVDKYITDRGKKPEDGRYYNNHYGMEMHFVKTVINVGGIDIHPDDILTNKKTFPRISVGSKGHYLVGDDAQSKKSGFLIEAEDGTDLYNQNTIVLIDEENEVYGICWNIYGDDVHVTEYLWALMNSDFKTFGRSDHSRRYYYCIDFDGLKVYAMSMDDPANTKYSKYFDVNGNKIEDIYKYLEENGKDPASGKFDIRDNQNNITGEGVFGSPFDRELLSYIAGRDEIAASAEETGEHNGAGITFGSLNVRTFQSAVVTAKNYFFTVLFDAAQKLNS